MKMFYKKSSQNKWKKISSEKEQNSYEQHRHRHIQAYSKANPFFLNKKYPEWYKKESFIMCVDGFTCSYFKRNPHT